MRRIAVAVTLAAAIAAPGPLVLGEDLRGEIAFLASSDLGGRLTGSTGEGKAAAFLVERLSEIGVRPLPGQDSLLLPFDFTAGVSDAGSRIRIDGQEWSSDGNVQALSFSDVGSVKAPVVFAGYGLRTPEGRSLTYDSFVGLDVRDKIVVVLRYSPEDADEGTRVELSRYSGLRYKAMHARELGARGILIVTGPRSPNAGELIPMTFDTAIAGSGILAASISGEVAEQLFARAGKSLEEAQAALDTANPHVAGFDLEGVEIELDVAITREHRVGHNVVGYLPGASASDSRPWLLLGAHYDHLGEGRHGNSLARGAEVGQIHVGADDNASGVVAVLATAAELATRPRARGVVVALWSGEELGLLGSTDFVRRELVPADDLMACLNFDMVGRSRDNRLAVQGIGSSPEWKRLVEQANVPVGFDLQLQEDPYLPTDSTSFNSEGVANLNFFTGGHEDYHRPTDTPDKIDYEDLDRVVKLAVNLSRKLIGRDEPLEFAKVEPKMDQGPARDAVRAYTGTIPDYTTEVEGLMLSGVIGGGPAEAAGLRGGDVIVRFGSHEIKNIYDYTYALEAVKVGEPLAVVFLRDGERMETTITPGARP